VVSFLCDSHPFFWGGNWNYTPSHFLFLFIFSRNTFSPKKPHTTGVGDGTTEIASSAIGD